MLDNKNNITLYIREVAKRVILESQYPRDVDPSSVKLTVPYKTGIIATIQDIQDAISKIDIDPDIDFTNLVDLKSEQTIEAIKKFQEGLQSLKEPKVDEDVVRLLEFKKLIEEIDIIKNTLGNINNVNITLEPDTYKNLENILNKLVTLIGTGPVDVDVNYTNTERVPTAIGGIAAGTTFDKVPIQDVITMLLYPYQKPAITQFNTTIKRNYKLGESTTDTLPLSWVTTQHNNIQNNSILFSLRGTLLPKEEFPKSGSKIFTITPFKLDAQGTVNIVMELTDIKGSKISRTITLTWLNGIYYGNVNVESPDASVITTLTPIDANSVGRDYTFPGGGYKCIAYPAAWGNVTQFIDPKTTFEVPMRAMPNVEITNGFGISQTYKVYRSTNVLNGDITIRVKQ